MELFCGPLCVNLGTPPGHLARQFVEALGCVVKVDDLSNFVCWDTGLLQGSSDSLPNPRAPISDDHDLTCEVHAEMTKIGLHQLEAIIGISQGSFHSPV